MHKRKFFLHFFDKYGTLSFGKQSSICMIMQFTIITPFFSSVKRHCAHNMPNKAKRSIHAKPAWFFVFHMLFLYFSP